MESKANLKRQLILNTAIEIVLENDFNALTLDAVAKQAGISKGGLLYHFPNKELLIRGLAQHIFEQFDESFQSYADDDPILAGKWSRALIKATERDLEQRGELNAGVLATTLLDYDAATTISESYQSILNKLNEDEINPVNAMVIRLALDGLYYSEMLNIAPLQAEMKNKVIQQLLSLTKEE